MLKPETRVNNRFCYMEDVWIEMTKQALRVQGIQRRIVPLLFREGRSIAWLPMFLSQSSFNELVNENVVDFEMTVEEAIEEAVKQAQLQRKG